MGDGDAYNAEAADVEDEKVSENKEKEHVFFLMEANAEEQATYWGRDWSPIVGL